MTPKKRRRLIFALALVVVSAGVVTLILGALRKHILYFYSPTQVATQHVAPGVAFRIGGLVAKHSVHHGAGAEILFAVTDGRDRVPVVYDGVLPALFREGQGVVALGALNSTGTFVASQILAKHDARYMPPDVVAALKRSGRWKGSSWNGSGP